MYEELKYKKIERRVGVYKNALLVAILEIQNNHLKLNFKKISKKILNNKVREFNVMSYKNKINFLDINFESSEYNYINKHIDEILNKLICDNNESHDTTEEKELINNVHLYSGEAMPLIQWMLTFSNKRLDRSIADVIPAIVNKLLEIDEPDLENKTESNYCFYTGNASNIKFCIGRIDKKARNIEKPGKVLVEFEGKGDSPRMRYRFWCLEKNLIKLGQGEIRNVF